MKTSTITATALGLVAVGSIGLNIFQAQSAHGMDQNFKAQSAKLKNTTDSFNKLQKMYDGSQIQVARQYDILIQLSDLAPTEFETAVSITDKKSDKELLKAFQNVGTRVPNKKAAKTATPESITPESTTPRDWRDIPGPDVNSYPTTESTAANATPESTTESTTAIVPPYRSGAGEYNTYQQYQAALKADGFTNITLNPQATTNKSADGYVYSVHPGVNTKQNKDTEIVVTYSKYQEPQ